MGKGQRAGSWWTVWVFGRQGEAGGRPSPEAGAPVQLRPSALGGRKVAAGAAPQRAAGKDAGGPGRRRLRGCCPRRAGAEMPTAARPTEHLLVAAGEQPGGLAQSGREGGREGGGAWGLEEAEALPLRYQIPRTASCEVGRFKLCSGWCLSTSPFPPRSLASPDFRGSHPIRCCWPERLPRLQSRSSSKKVGVSLSSVGRKGV